MSSSVDVGGIPQEPDAAQEPDGSDDDDIVMLDHESSSFANWECPCCLVGRRTAQELACGHLVCSYCIERIRGSKAVPRRCPMCRSSANGLVSRAVPLAAPRAKRGQPAIVLDLTHEDADETDVGATWPCPECTNLRLEAFACNRLECAVPRCKDCWERRPGGFCAFCRQGKRSQLPLRI